LCAAVGTTLRAAELRLGDQDFTDGQVLITPGQFATRAAGEPPPFDRSYGSDPDGTVFDQSWQFTYAPAAVGAASITLGIVDHDSKLPGTQLAGFSLDGLNLTALLNELFEARGGGQGEYNVYTLDLPPEAYPLLADGSATFRLALQSRGPDEPPLSFPGNGAGLDFATLRYDLPEPSAAGTVLACAALLVRRRRA
jgi:hypothetical protein